MIFDWNDYKEVEYVKIKDLTKEKIFTFDFPFYSDLANDSEGRPLDPDLKLKLKDQFKDKFMLNFRYESIGYSTLDEFKDHLHAILLINYPKYVHYYNAKVKAETLKWWNNKDYEYNQERTLKTENKGKTYNESSNNSSSGSESESKDVVVSTNKFSDTPEGNIDNIERFMTTGSKDDSTTTGHSEDKGESSSYTESHVLNDNNGNETETIKTTEGGNIGVTSSGELVKSWLKDGFIDIDKMMLKDCEELFMMVY